MVRLLQARDDQQEPLGAIWQPGGDLRGCRVHAGRVVRSGAWSVDAAVLSLVLLH